jgi:hypothetical protein
MKKAYWINSAAQTVCAVDYAGLADLQRMIGGYIEAAKQWPSGDVLYVDEDGLAKQPRTYFWITGRPTQPLCGNGVVVGREEEGDQFPDGYITHDPAITLEALSAEVRFISPAEAEAWAKANSSEPAVAISFIGNDGTVETDVLARTGAIFGVSPPKK